MFSSLKPYAGCVVPCGFEKVRPCLAIRGWNGVMADGEGGILLSKYLMLYEGSLSVLNCHPD